ncbi:glycosyltransferase [Sinorhizobium fredii]|uniref:glycosyltransferase n=1 Tax=Rhizobium fredii TaxID=380 RepID=UPI003517DA37
MNKLDINDRTLSRIDTHLSVSPPIEFDEDSPQYLRCINAIESELTAYVSFDIFDTALLRPYLEPKDLFKMLNKRVRDETGIINVDFAAQRAKAESIIRRKIKADDERRDPSLAEIYNLLGEMLGLSGELKAKIKKMEVDAEIACVYANPAVTRLFNYAKSCGKKVIFCSDTYFDRSTIEEMLERNEYVGYQRLFISSDSGATKKDGELFQVVASDLKVAPDAIVHFGDNHTADIKRAEEQGLRALFIKSPRDKFMALEGSHRTIWSDFARLDFPTRCFMALFANKFLSQTVQNQPERNLFSNSGRRFGYYAIGPLVYGLVCWIHRESSLKGVDHVYFLSRDGYLPLRVWNLLDLSGSGPVASYLHISRRAAMPLGVLHGDPIPTVFGTPTSSSYSVADFFRSRFGEEAAMELASAYKEAGLDVDERANLAEDKIVAFLSGNRQLVRNLLTERSSNAFRYYETETASTVSPAVFDVGRKGTFQNLLSRLLKKNFHGFYVVTEGAITDNAISYDSFFPQASRHLFPDEPDTVLYESLFSEVGPSIVGWDAEGLAVVDPETQLDPESAAAVTEIQNGALEFVSDVRNFFGSAFLHHQFNPRILNHLVTSFWNNDADCRVLGKIAHEDSLYHRERRTLGDYYRSRRPIKEVSDVAATGDSGLCHVVIYCPAMTRIRGGVERVVSWLTLYLARRGYRLTILTSGNTKVMVPKPVYPVAAGTIVRHVNVRDEKSVKRILRDIHPDVLVVMASGEMVAMFAKLARSMDIPLMLAERAEPAASRDTYWRTHKQGRYIRTYNKADVVSVQFQSFRKFFPKLMRKKVIALPNPVPPIRVGDFPDRRPVIVCVARIYIDQKGQDILVNAFAKIAAKYPDWVVHLYGAEREDDAVLLRSLIQKHGLEARVILKGSTQNIATVLSEASIFAFPSRFEGFPNALAEALSAGVPAIGLQSCAGTNELIVDGTNGLLVAGSEDRLPDSFAVGLDRLMSSEELRRKMGTAASASMEQYAPAAALELWERGIELTLKRGRRRKLYAPLLRRISGLFLKKT